MKIKNLSIGAFGKLSDKSFDFSDGINVIYGENEAGKSTICSFIKYMLYGFSSKSKEISVNDKLKYTPWNSETVFGSATLSAGGKNLRIERKTGAKSSLSVYDADSGDKLDFGKTPGEELLGVDETAFSKMAFIRQTDVSGGGMAGLSASVQNIVYSADETVNVEKARKKLVELRNLFYNKSRSTGKCFELKKKIDELEKSLDSSAETHRSLISAESKLASTRERIEENKKKISQLDDELKNIEAYEAKKLFDAICDAENKYASAKELLSASEKNLSVGKKLCTKEEAERLSDMLHKLSDKKIAEKQKKDELAACLSSDEMRRLSEFPESFRADGFSAEAVLGRLMSQTKKKRVFSVLAVLSAVCSAAFAAVAFSGTTVAFSIVSKGYLMWAICAAFAVLSAVFALIALFASAGMRSILGEHGVQNHKALVTLLTKYPSAKEALAKATLMARLLSEECEKLSREKSELLSALLSEVSAFLEDAETDSIGIEEKARLVISAIEARVKKHAECVLSFESARKVYESLRSAHNPEELAASAANFTGIPTREKSEVLRDKKFCVTANENLAEKEKDYIARSSVHTSLLRKPAEIMAEMTANKALLEDATLKADALELAIGALDGACEDVRMGVAPRICDRAGELFCEFTGGKYESLELSDEFSPGIFSDGIKKDADFLSTGTSDAAYLSLRIALCDELFSEKPTLVLDESFAHIDDERLSNILSCLDRLSEQYQIFIFTCHKREAEYLKKHGDAKIIML